MLILQRRLKRDAQAGHVIDLSAPQLLRRRAPAPRNPGRAANPPSPRLYPAPGGKPKSRPKRAQSLGGNARSRRRKPVYRRAVPNSRLYRPPAPRPPPPAAWPRTAWPSPTAPARLHTASRVALHLSEQRAWTRAAQRPLRAALTEQAACSPERAWCQPPPPAREAAPSRRLVVTLPAAPAAPRYRPISELFQLRSLDTDSGASTPAAALAAASAPPPAAAAPAMDAGNRHSTSPEDYSEGNETLSAPSEFLAEFLSAIMRRQYAEALKYCRLILQYEPHNATARGFYPLLQHKVQAHRGAEAGGWARGSSSDETSAPADKPQHAAPQDLMEQGADEWDGSAPASRAASRSSSRSRGSCASQSSLELDSSDALAHSSASLSLTASRRTEHTDSASAGCWESTGSASRSEPDDNGNAPASLPACAADVQNDNATPIKSESAASLRRLRAQFTCSIK